MTTKKIKIIIYFIIFFNLLSIAFLTIRNQIWLFTDTSTEFGEITFKFETYEIIIITAIFALSNLAIYFLKKRYSSEYAESKEKMDNVFNKEFSDDKAKLAVTVLVLFLIALVFGSIFFLISGF